MGIDELASIMATLGLAGLMFAMGLNLTGSDFTRMLSRPLAAGLGLFGQIIVLPATAFLIATAFQLSPEMALGLMIISACPGGPTSNAFSFMAKGDVALSITLTAVSSVIAFLTVPTVINLSITHFGYGQGAVSLSFVDSATRVFLTTALPVVLGMGCGRILPTFSERIMQPLFILAFASVLLPSAGLVIQQRAVFLDDSIVEASSAAALNILMTLIGFGLGLAARLPRAQAKTLSLEVGIQNFGLAFVIVHVFLGDVRLLLPGVVYLPSMLIVGFIVARVFSAIPSEDEPMQASPQST